MCMFTAHGVGKNEADNFTPTHHKKHNKLSTRTHTHTHTHTHTQGTGQNYRLQRKKCVLREDQNEWILSLSPWCLWAGHSIGKGWYIWRLAGHIALFYSPWAQEHQEMTRSPIEENEMECMAEWVWRDTVAGFHGLNDKWQKAAYGEYGYGKEHERLSHLSDFGSRDQVLNTQLHNVALGEKGAVEHRRSHQGHHHLVLGTKQRTRELNRMHDCTRGAKKQCLKIFSTKNQNKTYDMRSASAQRIKVRSL